MENIWNEIIRLEGGDSISYRQKLIRAFEDDTTLLIDGCFLIYLFIYLFIYCSERTITKPAAQWTEIDLFLYFFYWIFYVFTFQMLSLFPVSPPEPSTLGHNAFTGPRASSPADNKQCHPLLHMQLDPWVPPCILFGWWFRPWKLCGVWLVDIVVLSMGLQTLSAPWVLSLTPPLGTSY